MTAITAAMVKELRDKTGAGMMDCKKALAEHNGDMEAAIDWLRAKGLAAAQKKAGRVAADGLIGLSTATTSAALVEVNAETDFVARNEQFQGFVAAAAGISLACKGEMDAILTSSVPGTNRNVSDEITHLVATIGENMSLRRAAYLGVSQGLVATYMHNAVADGLGKIGVLVALESTAPAERLENLGKQIAMHVAAANPLALSVAELDPALVQRERDVLTEQARGSGKPEAIIEKMIEGRIRKYYQEVVLLEQIFVVDGETAIAKVVEAAAKEVGAPIKLAGYVRFALGEGIEKAESDFAAEVAAVAKG